MTFRSCLAVIIALLFTVSAIAQHVVAAGMTAGGGMEMQSPAVDMALPDDTTHCPASSDCAKDTSTPMMACFAHCAVVLGFLPGPAALPVSLVGHELDWPVVHPLASLHEPPEPHPPKPLILI
jgi:hypothetical protein